MGEYWNSNNGYEPNPVDELFRFAARMKNFANQKTGSKAGGSGSGGRFTGKKILLTLLGIAVGIWLLTGIYFVDPGEIGVVKLFGRMVSQTVPGPHYRLPAPIQSVDIVNMETIRRAEIGFRTRGNSSVHERRLQESLMLTGDENIADIQVVVQYQVRDAPNFLFNVRNPEDALVDATEVALRGTIGRTTIDGAMTTGRSQVEAGVHEFLQRLLDDYQAGLQINEVKLLVVDPPDQVKDAFHEVVRALEDKSRLVQEAEGYKEDLVPKARGQAEKLIKESEAYMQARILDAEGEAARFDKILTEYNSSKDVTRQRMFLEFVSKNMAGIDKYIINGRVGGDVSKMLPLRSFTGSGTASKSKSK